MRRMLSLAWLATLALAAPLFAQVAAEPVAVAVGDSADVLRKGEQLESQRRWGDALTYYEEAVRAHPNDRLLEQRFEFARLHFDCQRRHNDLSYSRQLEGLSVERALDLYGDVLLKIQAHYVESPNWKELIERGIAGLEVALVEPAFLRNCVATDRLGLVESFRYELRRTLSSQVVATRADARTAAAAAAELGLATLGMRPAAVVLEFTCGAANALDPYSAYLTPGQLAEVYSQIEGNFVGLGVELKAQDRSLAIVRVIGGSPAARHGIRAGDTIVAVDGRPTSDYTTDQAANLLQGPVGSSVAVAVVTAGQPPRTLRIERQRIEVPSIEDARLVDAPRGIGYLKLVSFQKNTARDLDAALWQLHHQGMRSLVIDLRGNPGGLLVTAVEVADRFVERGVLVSTRGRNTQEDFTYSAREEGTWRMPLVVLIDQDSASAAEIFAGAIRDHRRGTIVGCRSFGKGSVQGIFPLSVSDAGIRLTTARFYSPNGRPYSRIGVDPDVVVRRVARPTDAAVAEAPAADDALAAAVQQAAAQLAAR